MNLLTKGRGVCISPKQIVKLCTPHIQAHHLPEVFYCLFICRRNRNTAAKRVTAAYPSAHHRCGKISAKFPASTARSNSTVWTKGKQFAIFWNAPPTRFRSNQTPESHAERFVSKATQISPTCLSVKTLPHRSPRAIYRTEIGTMNKIALLLVSRPLRRQGCH